MEKNIILCFGVKSNIHFTVNDRGVKHKQQNVGTAKLKHYWAADVGNHAHIKLLFTHLFYRPAPSPPPHTNVNDSGMLKMLLRACSKVKDHVDL